MQGNEYRVPVVAVKSEVAPDGHMLINESDFDPAVHVKYEMPAPPPVMEA